MSINCRKMFRFRTGSLPVLLLVMSAVGSPVWSWQMDDRQAYNNKMALLNVMLEGAKQRAVDTNDLQTLCLVMSIGNDVTERYLQEQTGDKQIQRRLKGMRNDFTSCLGLLYKDP
tara:strand:+ start:1199 stop:1543 length:345 start_codon:yes stop_codon:yes gene_type:complete